MTVIIIKSEKKVYVFLCVCVCDVYFTKYGFLFLLLWLIISIYDIILCLLYMQPQHTLALKFLFICCCGILKVTEAIGNVQTRLSSLIRKGPE